MDGEKEPGERASTPGGGDLLKKTLRAGMHGPQQLKKEERALLLGQFRERVLKALTFKQIEETGTYPAVEEAIRDFRAKLLIISTGADLSAARDYIQLAAQQGLSYTTTSSPEFKGDVGLVVVADTAVDIGDIRVPDRFETLQQRGLSPALIGAVGKKLCPSCYDLLLTKAPEEAGNYKKAGSLDRLLGIPCSACTPGERGHRK